MGFEYCMYYENEEFVLRHEIKKNDVVVHPRFDVVWNYVKYLLSCHINVGIDDSVIFASRDAFEGV